MPRILITGGAGYIGSVLTEHLLARGHDVTVLDNIMYNQNSLAHVCHIKGFNFVFGDARDADTLRKILKSFDYIIPLAAIVGAPACDRNPTLATTTNYEAIALLNKLRDPKQRIVYPTTNSGYGTKSGAEMCDENTPLTPISLYGRTKVDAEKLLLSSPNAITLRLATVFGVSSRMRIDLLVNDFVYRAVRDGYVVLFEKDFKRNYVHIRDVARCFEHCISNFESMKEQPYNVGQDAANLSKEQLAYKIKEFVPDFYITSSQYKSDPDKRNYIVSSQKIYKTGFKCEYQLEDGIKELLKFYQTMHNTSFSNV